MKYVDPYGRVADVLIIEEAEGGTGYFTIPCTATSEDPEAAGVQRVGEVSMSFGERAGSDNGDIVRFADQNKAQEYSLENLKEIRVICIE